MVAKKKVLFVCTGNSCRSQIAEGLLRNMAGERFEVHSAGTNPSQVHLMAIAVMKENDIDISQHTSDHMGDYIGKGIDIVITVCDYANEACPTFPGKVERIHWSIDDPFGGWEYNPAYLDSFRKTRAILKEKLEEFLKTH